MKLLMNAYRHVMESLIIDLNFKCSIKLSCVKFGELLSKMFVHLTQFSNIISILYLFVLYNLQSHIIAIIII